MHASKRLTLTSRSCGALRPSCSCAEPRSMEVDTLARHSVRLAACARQPSARGDRPREPSAQCGAAHLAVDEGSVRLRQWFARRLRSALRRNPFPREFELCWIRVGTSFCAFPIVVGLAAPQIIGNAWPTSHRSGGMPRRHAFGCNSLGGDDLRRYHWCPALYAAILGSRAVALPPVSLQIGSSWRFWCIRLHAL